MVNVEISVDQDVSQGSAWATRASGITAVAATALNASA